MTARAFAGPTRRPRKAHRAANAHQGYALQHFFATVQVSNDRCVHTTAPSMSIAPWTFSLAPASPCARNPETNGSFVLRLGRTGISPMARDHVTEEGGPHLRTFSLWAEGAGRDYLCTIFLLSARPIFAGPHRWFGYTQADRRTANVDPGQNGHGENHAAQVSDRAGPAGRPGPVFDRFTRRFIPAGTGSRPA